MKYEKQELEKLILIDKLSYREIGKLFDVTDAAIKKAAKKLGILLPQRSKFQQGFIPHNKGTGIVHSCKCCGNDCKEVFCNKKCEGEFKSRKTYEHYLTHQDLYVGVITAMRFVKKFILQEQNHKCDICKMNDSWNETSIVFILDHIDGDASNNARSNLRLICPNCDSQLDTYKSKNKNSARKERYILNYKNNLKT